MELWPDYYEIFIKFVRISILSRDYGPFLAGFRLRRHRRVHASNQELFKTIEKVEHISLDRNPIDQNPLDRNPIGRKCFKTTVRLLNPIQFTGIDLRSLVHGGGGQTPFNNGTRLPRYLKCYMQS